MEEIGVKLLRTFHGSPGLQYCDSSSTPIPRRGVRVPGSHVDGAAEAKPNGNGDSRRDLMTAETAPGPGG